MRLGIDIDDTITKTTALYDKYLHILYPDISSWLDISKEERLRFYEEYRPQIMSSFELQDNVQEVINKLKNKGHKIIIITARTNLGNVLNYQELTKEYLANYSIPYDEIYFDEELKGAKALDCHIDLFIDDNERVLDNVSSYGIKCLKFGSSDKYLSFNNWLDIEKFIERIDHNG